MADVSPDGWSLSARISHMANFLATVVREIIEGVWKDRIPAHRLCYAGIMAAIALLFHVDQWIAREFAWKWHLPLRFRLLAIYLFLLSGWIVWGFRRAFERNLLLTRLKDSFESARLKCNGRYPSVIEDAEVDAHVRRLRLKTNGVTKSEFEAALEKMEAQLNVTIVRVLQDSGDRGKIDLLYVTEDLTKHAVLENPSEYADGEIPIGVTYEGPVRINLRDVGHILVAGQTGGGKSNFLKLVTAILSSNNPEAEIIFLDFKGGMESADLKARIGNMKENVSYVEGTANCAARLATEGRSLATRLDTLKSCGASTFDDYRRKQVSGSARVGTGAFRKDGAERKKFIIIDEVAQLASAQTEIDKEAVNAAKAGLNRIARQGRAAGVHLIVATQKPDSKDFDQTVKANLPGILCFPMANQASSVQAIGTKRAYELNPDIKGRAIWKFGPKLHEVQTYLFT